MIALLVLDGVLVGGFGVVTAPYYVGGVPVPVGALLSGLLVPWLVRLAGGESRNPLVAGAPLWAWLATVTVLGLAGPGGDVLLPATWQSLLLLISGTGTGLWALRRVTRHQGGGRDGRSNQ